MMRTLLDPDVVWCVQTGKRVVIPVFPQFWTVFSRLAVRAIGKVIHTWHALLQRSPPVGSRTPDLRILFRDLCHSTCVRWISRSWAFQTGSQPLVCPCWPPSEHTEPLYTTLLNLHPVLGRQCLGPRRHPVEQYLFKRPYLVRQFIAVCSA